MIRRALIARAASLKLTTKSALPPGKENVYTLLVLGFAGLSADDFATLEYGFNRVEKIFNPSEELP